jgi:hypothetical protein
MQAPEEFNIRRLRTPSGWYLIVQLDDLQSVCEHFYLRTGIRYTRDFYPPELRLPFLLKDSPTEDNGLRMLQVIEFEQAHQVVSYDKSLKPRGFRWRRSPEDLPDWIWDRPPWPHVDSSGYRQVCIGNAFFCASQDDQPMIDEWFNLSYSEARLVYSTEHYDTPMPYLIKVSQVEETGYAIVTAVPTKDLIFLVNCWGHYLGARNIPSAEWEKYSSKICRFIDNLIGAQWPLNAEVKWKPPNTM